MGKSWVLYNETEMTFPEAKEACAQVGSGLVEFWDEQDWGQVCLKLGLLTIPITNTKCDCAIDHCK